MRKRSNKAVRRKPGELSQIERLYKRIAGIICIKVNTVGRFLTVSKFELSLKVDILGTYKGLHNLIKCRVSSENTDLLLYISVLLLFLAEFNFYCHNYKHMKKAKGDTRPSCSNCRITI